MGHRPDAGAKNGNGEVGKAELCGKAAALDKLRAERLLLVSTKPCAVNSTALGRVGSATAKTKKELGVSALKERRGCVKRCAVIEFALSDRNVAAPLDTAS
jgi:hypothetical protein